MYFDRLFPPAAFCRYYFFARLLHTWLTIKTMPQYFISEKSKVIADFILLMFAGSFSDD